MKEKQPNDLASPVFKKRFARRTTTYRPFTFVRNLETQAQPQNQIVKQVGDRGVVITSSVQLQAANNGTSITDIVQRSPVPVIIANTAPDSNDQIENGADVEDNDAQDLAAGATPRRSRRSHEPSASFLSRRQYPTGTPQSAKAHRPDDHYIGSRNDSNIDEEISFIGEDGEGSQPSRKNMSSASARSAKPGKGKKAAAERSISTVTQEITSAKKSSRKGISSNTSSTAMVMSEEKRTTHQPTAGSGKRLGAGGKPKGDEGAAQNSTGTAEKASARKKTKNGSLMSEPKETTPAEKVPSKQKRLDSAAKSVKGDKSMERARKVVEKGPILDAAADRTGERSDRETGSSQASSPKRAGKGGRLNLASARGAGNSGKRSARVDDNDSMSSGPLLSERKSKATKLTNLSRSGLAPESARNESTTAVAESSAGRRTRKGQKEQVSAGMQELSAFAMSSAVSAPRSARKRAAAGGNEEAEQSSSPQKKARGSKTKETPEQREGSIHKEPERQKQSSSKSLGRSRARTEESTIGLHSRSHVITSSAAEDMAEAEQPSTTGASLERPQASEKSAAAKQGGQRRFFTDPERRTPQKLGVRVHQKVAARKPSKKGTPQASSSFWKTTRKVTERIREQHNLDVSMSSVYDDETFGEEFEPATEEGDALSRTSQQEGRWSLVQRQLQGRSAAAQQEKQAKKRQSRDTTELDVIADMLEDTEMEVLDGTDMSSACKSAVHKEFTFVRKQIQQTLKSHFRTFTRESRENHQQKCLLLKELQSLKQRGVDADMMRIDSWLQDFQALRQMCARPAS
ncbi:hypothetical protein BaRGS_00024070 [Batillaria attramentaria]|uniref:Uncharacterized protein n=1 Tax=Batillaria attramentaria TaxID=370345 RepID=A0ABD0KC70_9CAEN